MGTREEWEEIEASVKQKKQNDIKKYGADIEKEFQELSKKDIKHNSHIKKAISKIPKVIIIIIILFAEFQVFIMAYIMFANMKNAHDADVEQIAKDVLNTKVNLISKNVEEHGNGEYYFEVKKIPEIKFKAIKNYGRCFDDCLNNYNKYLFERWNSSEKEKITVKEDIDEKGLLQYELYIEINNYSEMENATEILIHYIEYLENWNKKNNISRYIGQKKGQFSVKPCSIYLKKSSSGEIIQPYHMQWQTAEEMRDDAKKSYIEITKNYNEDTSDIPKEILEKY